MLSLDSIVERLTRRVASSSSRRGFLGRLSHLAVGAAAVPLLPVARPAQALGPTSGGAPSASGLLPHQDDAHCEYWRYCAIDGYLCSCCGGTGTSCPPGALPSPVTWVGTCRNPDDGREYVVAYNDCCGKEVCGRCFCNRNEADEPLYRPFANNDINWCHSSGSMVYHCTVSIIQAAVE